jgi:hypothetical protein
VLASCYDSWHCDLKLLASILSSRATEPEEGSTTPVIESEEGQYNTGHRIWRGNYNTGHRIWRGKYNTSHGIWRGKHNTSHRIWRGQYNRRAHTHLSSEWQSCLSEATETWKASFRQPKEEIKQRIMANFVLGELISVLLTTTLHYSQNHVKVPSV